MCVAVCEDLTELSVHMSKLLLALIQIHVCVCVCVHADFESLNHDRV